MPKKARHGKASQHKKKRVRQPVVSTSAEATAIPAQPPAPAPASRTPTTKARTPAVRYPFVAAELRRIGIFAGATVIILIVLAMVL
jgi:hypothetical protein